MVSEAELRERINMSFPNKYRNDIKRAELQIETIYEICHAFLIKGDKFFLLEAPTGTGKSVIAKVSAMVVNHFAETTSVVLTGTKMLQKQYVKEFVMQEIMGSQNYDCAVSLLPRLIRFGDIECGGAECESINRCEYFKALQNFITTPFGVTNYHYFLRQEKLNAGLLICDEAHNLEQLFCSIYELNLTSKKVNGFIDYMKQIHVDEEEVKKISRGFLYLKNYIKNTAANNDLREDYPLDKSAIVAFITSLRSFVELLKNDLVAKKAGKSTKLHFVGTTDKVLSSGKIVIENTKDMIELIDFFMSKPENYVKSFSFDEKTKETDVTIKPLYPSDYSHCLFDRVRYVLLMSAKFAGLGVQQTANTLGISKYSETILGSLFPVENRPVFTLSLPAFNYKDRKGLMETYINNLDNIIETHSSERGLIHCGSYELQKAIIEGSKYKDRFIIPKRGEIFNVKTLSKRTNGIILSPVMYEGIDLPDELCRFQVLFTMPFPPMTDRWVVRKSQLDYHWYLIQTALRLIQAYGRGVRHPNDTCDFYILDGQRLKNVRRYLPGYVQDAIQEI